MSSRVTGAVNNGSSYVSNFVLTVSTVLELSLGKQRMLFPKIFISVQEAKESDVSWLGLLLYVPSQQLWSFRDGQFT